LTSVFAAARVDADVAVAFLPTFLKRRLACHNACNACNNKQIKQRQGRLLLNTTPRKQLSNQFTILVLELMQHHELCCKVTDKTDTQNLLSKIVVKIIKYVQTCNLQCTHGAARI
jgi:hypothetical protein